MHEDDLLPSPSHIVGPTWQRLRSGGFDLPEASLGDAIVNWMFKYLVQPSGPRAGENFLVTDEQYRFLLWWYAVDPETGRFIYRNGLLRRLKGWGKDPLAAAMAFAELCGPVQFSHWDDNGNPVGKPKMSAWVQIAAVSQDQTRNTFTLFPAMSSKKLREEFGLEIHKTIIYSKAGGMIEAVTSSPLALEGKRPTFVIKNETQWWVETNSGIEMANIIEGNVTKGAYGTCRSLSICNAHRPGEESDAERDWEAYQKVASGEAANNFFLYDALEAPADTPVGELADLIEDPEAYAEGVKRLAAGLEVAKGDADWLDTDTIVASILDPKNEVTESRRKFLNQINAAEDAWIAPREWDVCYEMNLEPLREGDRITLGFDGSKSNDWTALVACRVEDGALFPIKIWDPSKYPNEEVPREDVDAVVRHTFSKYDVVAMRADVREFEAYVDAWGASFGRKLKQKATQKHPVAYDMRSNVKNFTLDCERFQDAVVERGLVHNGSKMLRRHILNAFRRPNNYGISISKATKDSSRKIDAAVCAVLAFGARQEFLMGKKNKGRKVAIYR